MLFFGHGSKPMLPFWDRCTTHFSLFWWGLGCSLGARGFDPLRNVARHSPDRSGQSVKVMPRTTHPQAQIQLPELLLRKRMEQDNHVCHLLVRQVENEKWTGPFWDPRKGNHIYKGQSISHALLSTSTVKNAMEQPWHPFKRTALL